MRGILSRLALSTLLATAGAFSSAYFQVVNTTIKFSVTNQNGTPPFTKNTSVQFDQIDPSKYMIVGGTLSLAFETTYSGIAYNFTTLTLSGVAYGTTTQSISTPVSSQTSSASTSMFALFNNVPRFGTTPFTNLNGPQSAAGTDVVLSSLDLNSFYGLGKTDLVIQTTQTSLITVYGASSTSMGTATDVRSNVKTTLTLDVVSRPVPEASSIAQLSFGCFALVGFVRRKRKR